MLKPLEQLINTFFYRSNRKAPNLATYYFKHEDTDSEVRSKINPEVQIVIDESSDDEWTYSVNKNNKREDVIIDKDLRHTPVPRSSSRNIRRLVQEAEVLVRDSPVKKSKFNDEIPLNKMSRVKQWLNMGKPSDSCDASAEDEEKESQSSEDLNESIVTYKPTLPSQNTSVTELDGTITTPKVCFRQKKHDFKGNRPWSVSCISQLSHMPTGDSSNIPKFSISESALHQLSLSPKYSKTLTTSANSIGLYGNNSTSSTVEEGAAVVEEKSSVVRRRRLKLKRKASVSTVECLNEPHLTHSSVVSEKGNDRLLSNPAHQIGSSRQVWLLLRLWLQSGQNRKTHSE
jgi:hypothetical protein